MVRLVSETVPWILVDDCELARGGISYTIETVTYLHDKYNFPDKPGFVIGDDLVSGFHRWKNHEDLLNQVILIVAHRRYREKIEVSYPHIYLQNTKLPVSSSDIRERIARGKAFRFLLPEQVYHYILSHRLYMNAQ
jgi:nicotinate-nucleotide adenylyltransferase